MSDGLLRFFGIVILAVVLTVFLKKLNGESAVLLKMAALVCAAAACLLALSPIIDYIEELSTEIPMTGAGEWIGLLLRVLGVALLTQICATICRDCGEGSLASYVELGGKIEILILSFPLIRNMIENAISIIS